MLHLQKLLTPPERIVFLIQPVVLVRVLIHELLRSGHPRRQIRLVHAHELRVEGNTTRELVVRVLVARGSPVRAPAPPAGPASPGSLSLPVGQCFRLCGGRRGRMRQRLRCGTGAMPTPGRRLVGSHLRQAGNDVIQGHAELTPKKSVLLLQDLDVVAKPRDERLGGILLHRRAVDDVSRAAGVMQGVHRLLGVLGGGRTARDHQSKG